LLERITLLDWLLDGSVVFPAPFSFRFLQLNHENFSRRLSQICVRRTHVPRRFSELQQFRVAHLPQPITQRGNVELFFEPDTLHPRILHQGDRDFLLRRRPAISRHGGKGVVVAGCPTCRKRINTISQFLDHLANDAMPVLIEQLSVKAP
jgi:hypothetical protein